VRQHYAVWYAPPNAGKTTIAWQAASDLAREMTVLYVQFDASAADLKTFARKRNITVEQEDEANERQEVVFFMDSDKRTAKKNYMNVKASRMIKKVRENIIAVEKGIFPLGH